MTEDTAPIEFETARQSLLKLTHLSTRTRAAIEQARVLAIDSRGTTFQWRLAVALEAHDQLYWCNALKEATGNEIEVLLEEVLLEDIGLAPAPHSATELLPATLESTHPQHSLATFGVRNKAWHWFATGAYEEIFWRAYLGNPAYTLWSVLRAYQARGIPYPSQRTLTTLVAGAPTSLTTLNKAIDRLQTENVATRLGDEFYLQEELTLLTPSQAEELPTALQEEHERWLREYRILNEWKAISRPNLLPPLRAEGVSVHPFRKRQAS